MAKREWDRLLETYQGNAFPAMLEDLATHLGVSVASVIRIAPGWAPVVEFKKKTSYMGWWVVPERNDTAEVVGLSLRSQQDHKTMFPGSKHGLVYEVNPKHERGVASASPGHWIRTMDAGVLCPICGKPDGCLVNADNPTDPMGDAVCIRIREDAVRPMKMGYLHSPSGRLKGEKSRSCLADNGGPVIVVEGFSDVCAALDLGFDAVGRPSNLACMDLLADVVRGREVIVVGENDLKPNGEHPGREGMIAAYQVVGRSSPHVRMVMPPPHIKDLRGWLVKHGLTRERFQEYVDTNAEGHVEGVLLDDDRPLTIARSYLNSGYRMAGRYTMRRWRGEWYRYHQGRYQPISDESFRQPIRPWAHERYVRVTNPTTGAAANVPIKAHNGFVDNLIEAIKGETLIEDSAQIPCWINGHEGPAATDMVVFANGILHLPSYYAGDESALLEPSPDLFTTAALPFAFDPTATCEGWLAFLHSTLGDESEKITLLREWMGYCMVPDKSMQKMLFMRGPTAAGKSEILNVICQLVGRGQYAASDFGSLAGPFGLSPLMGKLVCVVGDARVPRQGDAMRGLELLLNLTGNDDVQVNRKFKDQIDAAQITARISMASNEILELPDSSSALLRRLLILEFKRSFRDNPDTTLRARLANEIPGICLWALEGLRRVRMMKRFTRPQSSIEAENEWRIATNPLAAFVEECCDVADGTEVPKEELFDAWSAWGGERRMKPTTKSWFYERMRTAVPTVTSATYEKGIHKISVYRGLALKAWAARRFTGRPS